MKKSILLLLAGCMSAAAFAQDSTSLFQNFNECDSAMVGGIMEHFPPGWSAYPVINGGQAWGCEPTYGVSNSPCMEFNDYVKGFGDNQDEDWLISPKLNLSSYAGKVFLSFSAEWYFAGDSLHVMVSSNYSGTGSPDASGVTWTELAHNGCMICDSSYNTDTFGEIQVELTAYKSAPVYVGWKYTSTDTDGSRWDIDSVFTGTVSFGAIEAVNKVEQAQLPLLVLGESTPNAIKLEFSAPAGGYTVELYDMMGRTAYTGQITAQGGEQSYTITNCNLLPGMYVVKLGNDNSYGVTRTLVQ